jgi:DNA polymerase III delta prime subunit
MVSRPTSIARRRAILTAIVDIYLSDRGFEQRSRSVIQSRNSRVTALKGAVEQFISGTYTLANLREQIDKVLTTGSSASDTDSWGVRGRNFMESLEKFANNHDADEPRSADTLRRLLTGLNANNLGQRIEEFHIFLVEEEKMFQDAAKQEGSNVSPGYSAFILSMFAFWLNSAAKPIIYYLHLCRGLKMLLNVGVLPDVEGLHIVHDRIEVQSQADHLAFLSALDALVAAVLQIKTVIPSTEVFWTERFTLWITSHPYELEQATREDTRQREGRILKSEYLPLIEETRLQQLINQLRRYILIDERVVRRIYHALLSGHVILTGPPGTGKTELAKLIPEILWQQDTANEYSLPTAYSTHIVTATDEWSAHTLLGGIVPHSDNGQISYTIQYGYLTEVVRKNWMPDPDNCLLWKKQRITSYAPSNVNNDIVQEFRGQWLVIDEFNRAPIDLALGEVLTTLSTSGGMLRVPTNEGYASLPFPHDFRIIGTLNSFDRNYLNQISEALKRRFSFIEVLPPTRQQRNAEQAIVLYAALKKVMRLSQGDNNGASALPITEGRDNSIEWDGIVGVEPQMTGSMIVPYEIHWHNNVHPFTLTFNAAWRILEVIRIYRQLGTAQAITLFQQIIITGLIQGYKTKLQWNTALDDALCDTIADQLQVLMPDELNILYWYVKHADDKAGFINAFNAQLPKLYETSERRLRAQLEAISSVISTDGNILLSESEVERLTEQANVRVRDDILTQLFYLDEAIESLPQFAYRLRTLRTERGL